MGIASLYDKYRSVNVDEINKKHKIELEGLKKYTSEDLCTLDEHRMFLELLRKFRQSLVDDLDFYGKNFKNTIEKLLSVGEDGVYSNRMRFLYELIQNVDDCNYINPDNCKLDILFDTGRDVIILEYNEDGFTPFNVFAITGIAEEAKNISTDKIEIGEKGIGFKSVFGIAESVLVQSGMFSFELFSDSFIVPKPCYDNFSGQNGTKLTLKLKPMTALGIYREIAKQYSRSEALFTKNPVLFLNKLTDVKFYIDNSVRYLKFHVDRSASLSDDKQFEDKVLLTTDIEDADNNRSAKNEMVCFRYSMPIFYDRKACISRYSDETVFINKKHYLIAVLPHANELKKSGIKGALYSFLPTQIRMSMPIALHAPYKLDSSREFVDPQDENDWFNYTNEKIDEFLRWLYTDLTARVKENIVPYLPRKSEYYFNNADSEKVKCLRKDFFKGNALLEEALFYVAEGAFKKASDITYFAGSDAVEAPYKMHSLLSLAKPLFVPAADINMSDYGVDLVENVYEMLFTAALKEPQITVDAFEILHKKEDFKYIDAIERAGSTELAIEQIITICKYENIRDAFLRKAEERIKGKRRPYVSVESQLKTPEDSVKKIIDDVLVDIDSENPLLKYIGWINRNYAVLPDIPKGSYFACANVLVLSEKEPIDAFASFAKSFLGKTIEASLRIRQASESLNSSILDKSMSNAEYLSMLAQVRRSIRQSFGKDVYDNYIRLINNSGADDNRFIKELLQNADDCSYSESVGEPCFLWQTNGNLITTYYNEEGFTKANVRSITAIGESTKKQVLSESSTHTGEKGVGFKTVFAVANEVAIHSNGFNFKLTDEMPTVPQKTDIISVPYGTKMLFKLKRSISATPFTDESVLVLCLCLRKIKKITLDNYNVEIDDSNVAQRKIFVNGEKYSFNKIEHTFTVTDAQAIAERKKHQRIINPKKKICIYIPADKKTADKLQSRYLYAGLPTTVRMNIPLVIDAPFEVTTSREGVTQGLWNKIIREETFAALIYMLNTLKHINNNDIFKYINSDNGIFDNLWLNDYPLNDRIANEALVSLLGGDFAAPNKQECWIYPGVCQYLFENNMVTVPQRNIVSETQYEQILLWLGCKRSSLEDFMTIIAEAVQAGHIANHTFRKKLYTSLKGKSQTIHDSSNHKNALMQLAIVPVKPKDGSETQYVFCWERIYTSSEMYSTDEYYLLDEEQMSTDSFLDIFRKSVSPMDESQKQTLYRKKIIGLLDNSNKQQTAVMLLNEFHNNRCMLDVCKYELIGLISKIPFMFRDGNYHCGKKFTSGFQQQLLGTVTGRLVVAQEYTSFAEYLECKPIYGIHYDDINCELDELTSEDIEDFLHGGFTYKDEIIRGFITDGKVPYDLIIQYNLEYHVSSEVDVDYNFPANPINSEKFARLRERILSAELNKYNVKKIERSERIPQYTFTDEDKRKYALEEYKCGNGIHFCQMCQEPAKIKYIEINAIEYEPKYAWRQMQLCFCLTCSKDFEYLRKNADIRNAFLAELMDSDINDDEPVAVAIDNRYIYFTATHLAEIQEIIKRQNGIGESE